MTHEQQFRTIQNITWIFYNKIMMMVLKNSKKMKIVLNSLNSKYFHLIYDKLYNYRNLNFKYDEFLKTLITKQDNTKIDFNNRI